MVIVATTFAAPILSVAVMAIPMTMGVTMVIVVIQGKADEKTTQQTIGVVIAMMGLGRRRRHQGSGQGACHY
jgi:hypothetical protein